MKHRASSSRSFRTIGFFGSPHLNRIPAENIFCDLPRRSSRRLAVSLPGFGMILLNGRLPEELATHAKIADYLNEVEATRKKGFGYFESDSDLTRKIPAPEQLTPIFDLLLETAMRAGHLQGRAFAVFQLFSSDKLPRI